jgi:hypothetical protein
LSVSRKQIETQESGPKERTLEELRLTMDKWIETQQIISKERKDWQQGKEIILNRTELVKKEISFLEEKIKQAQDGVTGANSKRAELESENETLKVTAQQLTDSVAIVEDRIRSMHKLLPEPVKERLLPLYQRVPEDSSKTRVSIAERYQNALGILNELNKANNEITVTYEVRTLAGDKPAEVKTVYVGLGQAYYVSAGGEAGIGRPAESGWAWEPSKSVSREILGVLDILSGKQSPAFVRLPVKME